MLRKAAAPSPVSARLTEPEVQIQSRKQIHQPIWRSEILLGRSNLLDLDFSLALPPHLLWQPERWPEQLLLQALLGCPHQREDQMEFLEPSY